MSAKEALQYIKEELHQASGEGNKRCVRMFEENAEEAEKENLMRMATRQNKFISQLKAALVRMKNGTYGVCVVTGELIPKERLRSVPHTTHSVIAKQQRDYVAA